MFPDTEENEFPLKNPDNPSEKEKRKMNTINSDTKTAHTCSGFAEVTGSEC